MGENTDNLHRLVPAVRSASPNVIHPVISLVSAVLLLKTV